MHTRFAPRFQAIFFAVIALAGMASGQTTPTPGQPKAGVLSRSKATPAAPADDQASALASAQQTAHILGLDSTIRELRALQAKRGLNKTLSPEEVSLRLQLLESVQIATLDIDGVVAEITNERYELGDIRAALQSRRDKSVARYTTAALLTGSGVGIAVNATQYSSLSNRTSDAGDTLAIVSGAASTVLSIIAARRQKGPKASVGDVPNMLAPLLGGKPVLNTNYPPEVLQYLESVPPGEDASRGTRLDQMKDVWVKTKLLSSSGVQKQRQAIAAATSSGKPEVKVSIDDLTHRMEMLGDVEGRVSLMKRDLSVLMRSYTISRVANPAAR